MGERNTVKVNIRIINFKRLLNSKVLLINLTSANTELAKNLVLSGLSLDFYDKNLNSNTAKLVEANDTKNNFYLNFNDIGKEVINILIYYKI